jgi:hypothetical protein
MDNRKNKKNRKENPSPSPCGTAGRAAQPSSVAQPRSALPPFSPLPRAAQPSLPPARAPRPSRSRPAPPPPRPPALARSVWVGRLPSRRRHPVGPTCQPQRKSSHVHLPTPHNARFSLSPALFARPTLPSLLSSPQPHGTASAHRRRPSALPRPCGEPAPIPLLLPISLLTMPAAWPRARPGAPMARGLELGQRARGALAWRPARLLAARPLL